MKESRKNILIAFIFNFSFTIIELVGGILTNSIAILSDSIHDFGDCVSIGTAYFLEKKSEKGANKKYTFGYARYSVLAAFITSAILLVSSGFVIYESIKRIMNPAPVHGWGMFGLAILGVIINGIAVLRTIKSKSINEKSISLHLLEDVLGWVVVLIGSIFMLIFNVPMIDSILSILVTVFILYNVVKNLIQINAILMQKCPKNFKYDEFVKAVGEVQGVVNVHHIHVWTIDGENTVASLHLVVSKQDDSEKIIEIKEAVHEVCESFEIKHLTLQTEFDNEECESEECKIEVHGEGHHHHH